jgi:RimJ/RimL family protein N-acetyltransferase
MALAPVLESERLRLRPHRQEDFDGQRAMLGDPEVMRHVGGSALSAEDAWRRMLCAPGLWALLGYGYWAIEAREDDAYLGQIGFADFKREMRPSIIGVPEMGWMLVRAAWGRGIASEAARLALDWAGSALDHRETVAIIDPGNAASIRIAEKAGFATREPAFYREEEILLFRRPLRRGADKEGL